MSKSYFTNQIVTHTDIFHARSHTHTYFHGKIIKKIIIISSRGREKKSLVFFLKFLTRMYILCFKYNSFCTLSFQFVLMSLLECMGLCMDYAPCRVLLVYFIDPYFSFISQKRFQTVFSLLILHILYFMVINGHFNMYSNVDSVCMVMFRR